MKTARSNGPIRFDVVVGRIVPAGLLDPVRFGALADERPTGLVLDEPGIVYLAGYAEVLVVGGAVAAWEDGFVARADGREIIEVRAESPRSSGKAAHSVRGSAAPTGGDESSSSTQVTGTGLPDWRGALTPLHRPRPPRRLPVLENVLRVVERSDEVEAMGGWSAYKVRGISWSHKSSFAHDVVRHGRPPGGVLRRLLRHDPLRPRCGGRPRWRRRGGGTA